MDPYDVAVIGGGPAGLFCAIHAASPSSRVVLFEKNEQPGKKLLLSGTGQCNITHAGEIRDFLTRYGDHGKFVKPALMGFSNTDLIRFFSDRGLAMMEEENGKIFPKTRSAADVLSLLLGECRTRGVEVRCGEPVHSVAKTADGFLITTGTGAYPARSVVITAGGASYPKTGSTGDGARIAAALGQPVTDLSPALTPVSVQDYPFAALAGIPFEDIPFSLWHGGKKTGSFSGDILFTHTGLSGPGILDASRYFTAGDMLRVSFAGKIPRDAFERDLAGLLLSQGTRLVRTAMAGLHLPDRLLRKILELSGVPDDLTCAHLTTAQRKEIVTRCTEFPFVVDRLGDFSIAMATRGGIALEHVNQKTMESKIVPGLFFAGEVLDIDGDTGGYNLQAAFSTGYAAAMALRKRRDTPS
ncbi:BaiN/RdsA family NAD(P)/FAD-dependent oxidoreductase [Methanoregula formicica]|uniref:Flavoprotein, HI0933 family n=1 Tax=Methanoregula formicica (strain DSM 22288 / NBRC 105244 / SMSP) TaxID=593750 RepID=L0HGE3_METFS|nr:NAD(P)/FAD-dependent oxidoreductase [Methanoregula formicica]AGB02856.1 flavoprotein, HI0933 family [Methanoregula formicica SMSP]